MLGGELKACLTPGVGRIAGKEGYALDGEGALCLPLGMGL